LSIMQTAHNKIIYHFKRVMSIILRILQDKYLCFTKIFDRTAFKKQF